MGQLPAPPICIEEGEGAGVRENLDLAKLLETITVHYNIMRIKTINSLKELL